MYTIRMSGDVGQKNKACVPELFCEICSHYPIEPVHGHFVCPACKNITKCCEGMPLEAV